MNRKLSVLIIFLALIIGTALVVRKTTLRSLEKSFLPGISAEAVRSITIRRNNESLLMERSDHLWRLKKPVDIPVRQDKIREFLNKIENMCIGPVISTQSEKMQKFEVDEKAGVQLTLSAKEKSYTVILGKSTADFRGLYIRFPEEQKVYMSKGLNRYYLTWRWQDWAEREIISFQPEELTRFTLTRGKRETEFVSKDGKWSRGKEKTVEKAVPPVVSILKSLRAIDFLKPGEGQEKTHLFDMELFLKNESKKISLYRIEGSYYVQAEPGKVYYKLQKTQGQTLEKLIQ